jgi:hypothetical protein
MKRQEVADGALDRATSSPNFMGLTSLGLYTGIFCDFLYSVLLFNASLGLHFLGLTLSRPQGILNELATNLPIWKLYGWSDFFITKLNKLTLEMEMVRMAGLASDRG